MIDKTISHYKILEKIGEGGMGVVYKALDLQLQRLVALKSLPPHIANNPDEKARFLHEARSASALNHPNVTTIYGIEEAAEGIFIAMEYVEGETVKKIIEKKTFTLKKILEIAIQVCEGLTAAHKKEIVHRDIKSDNIMATKEGHVKIMDFGLAKLKGATKLTQAGTTIGTADYMSPEQAQGEEIDSRSDIFSFGVVLYELLTGQLPFPGEHHAAIIYSILNEEPQPLARFNNQVSLKLQDIVSKALAKDKEERYQHIDELLADLRREKKSLEYIRTGQIPAEVVTPKPKKRLLPFLVPAAILFIVVLAFLILKPFKLEIGPEQKAIAKENSLAIMYFENVVDPEDKDKIAQMITSLLITDLSESQYMQVVSRQRLYDVLKLLGKEDLKVIDKSVASEVAKKAEVKWILTGEVLQVKPNLVLTAELSEATGGKVLKAPRVTGKLGEDLFAVVDRLSAVIKKDLSLPEQAKKEEDKSVAEVTTRSPEAYRYYLEGLDQLYKLYYSEAEKSFKNALNFDSTFAMAYYWLAAIKGSYWVSVSLALGGLSGDPEAKELIAHASKNLEKVTQREKYYIKALEAVLLRNYPQAIKELQKLIEKYPQEKEAFYALGWIHHFVLKMPEQAAVYYKKAIEIDPLYKLAYNYLAYCYDLLGDFENSIVAINKYVTLAPDEANPYDTRGDLYSNNGKIDLAIESYKKALEIKSDFYFSWRKLGRMYLFKREYVKAESCYQELASSNNKDIRSQGRTYLAFVPLYKGKFEETLKILDQGIAADRMERTKSWTWEKHWLKADIYYEGKKNLKMALEEVEKSVEGFHRAYPDDPVYGRGRYIRYLAEKGDIDKAKEVAKSLKDDIEKKDTTKMYNYWAAVGFIERAKGNLQVSLTNLGKWSKADPSFRSYFTMAKVNLEAGRLEEAVAEFEKVLSRYDESRAGIYGALIHYLLGLAYEKSDWNQKAIKNYEEFLEIWKNADPGIPEVEDAKIRLTKLKTKT